MASIRPELDDDDLRYRLAMLLWDIEAPEKKDIIDRVSEFIQRRFSAESVGVSNFRTEADTDLL